jgi:acyl-CoA thioester hydrolase
MGRLKIHLPDKFIFSTSIPVRISDLNYGGHVGNDSILSIIHEGRMQFLRQFNFTEIDCGGVSLIMSDVCIEFKHELFYGDKVNISITSGYVSKVAFDLFYKLEKSSGKKIVVVALAKSGMVCYNYELKKVAVISETLKEKLFSNL